MFNIYEEQAKKLKIWQEEQDAKVFKMQKESKKGTRWTGAYYGCSGGAYSYTFTPTTLGMCLVVRNSVTKEEIDLTDYDNW